jgi:glycosyltransferase involved in cell wall biosynthesis
MRVLHVSDCYWPSVGGIELHLRDLVRHQRAEGHDARVVTTAAPGAARDDPWVHRIETTTGGLSGLVRADVALGSHLESLAPDVVHAHLSVFSPFATLAARRAATAGHPTVVTVHSLWSPYARLTTLAGSVLRLRDWPLVWSAVSTAAAGPVRALLGPDHPVDVLPNAVDPDLWPASPTRIAPVIPTVVSVMRLTRTKRSLPLARILRVVRRGLPADQPLRAVVVGDGPQRPALERYLRRHRMDSWVEVPGGLGRPGVRARLELGSVFLAPAVLESFGIAALEARALGLPVVASSRGGVGEFIEHGTSGLLGATDQDLAAHVTRLLTDVDLRSRIAHHNTVVPPRHDWARACRQADALYLRAMTARSGAAPVSSLTRGAGS